MMRCTWSPVEASGSRFCVLEAPVTSTMQLDWPNMLHSRITSSLNTLSYRACSCFSWLCAVSLFCASQCMWCVSLGLSPLVLCIGRVRRMCCVVHRWELLIYLRHVYFQAHSLRVRPVLSCRFDVLYVVAIALCRFKAPCACSSALYMQELQYSTSKFMVFWPRYH